MDKFAALLPHLNEKQRRLVAAAEARALEYGGVSRVARASGMSRPTIHKGLGELDQPPGSRVRRAGGGGSSGARSRLWKTELQRLSTATGLTITVCHLPPGTSTWNKIEHRLFSHISMNWCGRPLTSHEVILDLIGATTKVKVSDEEIAALT